MRVKGGNPISELPATIACLQELLNTKSKQQTKNPIHLIKILISAALTFLSAHCLFSEEIIRPSIVGGENSEANAYPWMVALVRIDSDSIANGQFCGGMLIHPYWILTAAHCVNEHGRGAFEIAVSEGDLNGNVDLYQHNAIFVHPEVDPMRIARSCDIALIRLAEPITDVKPIALQRAASILAIGRGVKTLGWGLTSYTSDADTTSAILKEVDAVISEIDYREENDPVRDYFVKTDGINPTRGTHSGDSGGPMLIRSLDDPEWKLAGVTSFGERNVTHDRNANYFAKISYAAPWIDSVIAHPFSVRPEIKPTDRIVTGIMRDGVPKVGYRFWPFADGPSISMRRVGSFYDPTLPSQTTFLLNDSRHIYNPDGSFIFVDPGFTLNGRPTTSSLMRIQQSERESFGNAPIPIKPFNRIKGRSPDADKLTFDKSGETFIIEDLEAGRNYTYPISHRLYAARNGKITAVDYQWENQSYKFTAEADTTYFLTVNEYTPWPEDFEFGIMPLDALEISLGNTTNGTLSTESHPYKNEHTRVELLESSSASQGEVRLELYSEFDAELQLFDKVTANKIGYYDLASENETETFIFSAEDLQESMIAVHNYDKDIFGNFSATLYSHTNPSISFDKEQQYAVTKADDYFTDSETGETIYYERFLIRGRTQKDHTKVETYVPYGDLGVAVYDGDNLVDFNFGEPFGEIEFESVPHKQYEIYVYDFDDYQNVNFELTISDSVGSTLSDTDPSDKIDPLKKSSKRYSTRALSQRKTKFESFLKEHQSYRTAEKNETASRTQK